MTTGQQGEPGTTGSQGEPGVRGVQGNQGNMGNQGNPGEVGATGGVGASGAVGAVGQTGIQGIQGPAGRSLTRTQALAMFLVVVIVCLGVSLNAGRSAKRAVYENCLVAVSVTERANALQNALAGIERQRASELKDDPQARAASLAKVVAYETGRIVLPIPACDRE